MVKKNIFYLLRKKHKQINFYKHILLYICTLSQNYREKRKVLKINNSKTQLVFTIFIYYKKDGIYKI